MCDEVSHRCECVARTCADFSGQCGVFDDGCGKTINCDECAAGFYCDFSSRKCVKKPQSLSISNIVAVPASDHASIYWQTSIGANSKVEFGESRQLGSVEFDALTSENHFVTLTALRADTKYYYRVSSSNSNVTGRSGILSFRTKSLKKTENLKIFFIAVDPATRVQFEGQYFLFTAVTSTWDQNSVLEWDFGDGKVEEFGRMAAHSYNLTGYGGYKDFVVKVRLKGGASESAAEVKVRVLKAPFKAVVVKPAPFTLLSKKGELTLKLYFLDKENNVIPCSQISLNLSLAGHSIRTKCYDKNYFTGSLKLWPELGAIELVVLNAEYHGLAKTSRTITRIPLYFKSLPLGVTDVFGKTKYHLKEEIGPRNVSFLLDQKQSYLEQLNVFLVSGDGEKKKIPFKQSGRTYAVLFGHKVSEVDLKKGLWVKFEGKDSRGNKAHVVQRVPLSEEHPFLHIVLLEPDVNARAFVFDQVMSVKAKLFSKNAAVKDKSLVLKCDKLGLSERMQFDPVKREYSYELLLPNSSSGLQQIEFELVASARFFDEPIASLKSFKINLSNDLNIHFLLPKQEKTIIGGPALKEIRVQLYQPNKEPFISSSPVPAFFSVDNNIPCSISLKFDNKNGFYRGNLPQPVSLGRHVIKLSLTGEFRGSQSLITSVEQPSYYTLLPPLFLAILVAVAAFFSAFFVKAVIAERRYLLGEKDKLYGLRKKFKYEFYKRHISEKELNYELKHIDSAINEVKSLLRHHSWLYVGFLRALFRTDNPKKFPKRFQHLILVNRLAALRGEFSLAEITRVLNEEKYDSQVIEKVIGEISKF